MALKKKKPETSINDLAVMIKKGFDSMDERFEQVGGRLDLLERGQEDIKLRLGEVAFRFELVELQKRVKILEGKMR